MRVFFASLCLLSVLQLSAQVSKDSPLYQAMSAQSIQLYEQGFNQCDMAYLERIVHESLSAYYERSEAQDRAKFFSDVQKLNCSNPEKKIIRKVDPNSLEVFSLDKNGAMYGAVQSGSVEFYLREPGKPDHKTGTGKFTQLWLLENGMWKLKEIMSYSNKEVTVAEAP